MDSIANQYERSMAKQQNPDVVGVLSRLLCEKETPLLYLLLPVGRLLLTRLILAARACRCEAA